MNPKVSILISVKDQLVLTKKCIECLQKTLNDSVSCEVLIANDASIDETAKYLDELLAPYRVFHRDEFSHGFAKNNNWLAEEAKGVFAFFK